MLSHTLNRLIAHPNHTVQRDRARAAATAAVKQAAGSERQRAEMWAHRLGAEMAAMRERMQQQRAGLEGLRQEQAAWQSRQEPGQPSQPGAAGPAACLHSGLPTPLLGGGSQQPAAVPTGALDHAGAGGAKRGALLFRL